MGLPGPDIASYRDRQIAILDRTDWAAWLSPSVSTKKILKPLPAGALVVEQVTLSFACPCVGAHKQKDEPTSDCSCDGHVRLEGAAVPALHIRSAIFKISQPKAVKATHQKSMTDTLPFAFYMKPTPLAARPQVTNCESQIGAKPAARTPLLKQASFSVVKGAARSRR
jgi:hypothetical protein